METILEIQKANSGFHVSKSICGENLPKKVNDSNVWSKM
jgi:hypothetical protein